MELKRRFIHNHDQQQNKTEAGDEGDLLTAVEQETLPGIPSRKSIHSKPQKKTTKLTLGYTLSLMAILSVLGGSGWWIKSQISHPATPVLTPEIKKLEPNKEVQKQPLTSNHAPKDDSMAKAEQPPKQTLAAQLPTDILQQSQASEVTKPEKAQKKVAKPIYKKIIKHKVGAGETLYRISVKYYYTGRYAAFLGRYNRIHDPSNLISGTFIRIPFPPGK